MDSSADTANQFDLDSITSNPHFNFLLNIQNSNTDNDNENLNFFSNSNDSPYDNCEFNCEYIDVNDFVNKCSSKKLSILTLNIQSLQSKFNDFKELVVLLSSNNSKPDVICLQELWQINANSNYNIDGYKPLVYKVRHGSVQGGGVGIYVCNNLDFTIDEGLSVFFDRVFESLVIEISNKTIKKTKIVTVYRPGTAHPNLSSGEQLTQSLDLLSNLLDGLGDSPSYICGDLNLDVLNHNKCMHVTNYIDLLFSHGFIQTITKPTRCTSHSATIIDHCITNVLSNVYNSAILTTKISDHFPILINADFCKSPSKQKTVSFRDFSTKNINNFRRALSSETWDNIYEMNDVQVSYNLFSDKFFSLYELFFPLKTCKFNVNLHKLEKWYTNGLIISRSEKIRLDKVASRTPSPANIIAYKTYRNLYNKLLKAAKKMYFEKELCKAKCDLKKTWNLIRNAVDLKSKKSSSSIISILIDNKEINSKKEIAEFMNRFFATAPSLIVDQINNVPFSPSPSENNDVPLLRLQDNAVTASEIINTVKLLEGKKSTDMNGVSMLLIKNCIWSIATPLAFIFNKSFETGIIPSQFKISKVVPIFKSGDPRLADNYCPISLISNISKILEKIMGIRLTAFLENNSLITSSQFGFRKNHSTIHPIVQFQNFITNSLNRKEHAIAIFCDLRKAFDTVDHKILFQKLYKLGVRGVELDWFKNYLTNRFQFVSIDEICSTLINIKIGVPQGSVLGPLLFLVYINDLPLSTQLFVLMFADDTTLLASSNNIVDLYNFVNAEFYKLTTYFRLNKLALHPDKTKYMLFTNNNNVKCNNLSLIINNNNPTEPYSNNHVNPITRVYGNPEDPSIKFLGVYIDPKLNFKHHVNILVKKLSSSLYFMRKAKNIVSTKAMKFIYYSIFHSHIIYAIQSWSSCSQSSMNTVFKMQKKAIRIISGTAYNSHTESLFKEHSILPLPNLITFFKLQFMQNYTQGFLPTLFNNVWITAEAHFNAGQIQYALRNRENFYMPISRLSSLDIQPYFMFPKLWQEFDDENVKILRDKTEFKSKLKDYFLNKLNSNYTCTKLLCPSCHIPIAMGADSDSSS